MTRDLLPPEYRCRFIGDDPALAAELVNLYHLARTALAGQDDSRYRRMLWAAAEFAKARPAVSRAGAYKDLDGLLT